jgi:PKD repeat protein
MKFLKKTALFVFISTVFVMCKKEELPKSTTVGQPVFSFNGTIGSTNLNLQAGVNNYYMFSTYKQDSAGVYNFTGNLQNSNGTPNNSISITINDYKVSGNVTPLIDSSLIPAYYSFNKPGGNTTSYSVQFMPILGGTGTPASYSWIYGDGRNFVFDSASSPVHIYSHPGHYNTSLTVKFDTGGGSRTTTLPNIIKVGTPDASNVISGILLTQVGNNMQFTAAYSGNPKTFEWKFGDNMDTTTNYRSATHRYINPGMYMITLTVTDANNNVTVYNQNIVTYGYSEKYVVNYTQVITPLGNPLSLSNVTVNYTDGSGVQYTSNNSAQPPTSSFQVTSVSNYQNNISNNPTKMLKVTFNCMLYPVSGGTAIAANNCTATIAVAYP